MKKLLIGALFFCISGANAQNTTIHFYYGQSETLGAEIMFTNSNEFIYVGGGFAGALNADKVSGEKVYGDVNTNDMKYLSNHENEQWCSIYGIGGVHITEKLLLKPKLGLSVWQQKMVFLSTDPVTLYPLVYNKSYKLVYQPFVGLGAMYPITDDFGVEVGIDNFNKCTFGFTVLF